MTYQSSKRARLALDHLGIPPQPRTPPIRLVRKYQRALPNARRATNDDRTRHRRLAALGVRKPAGPTWGGGTRAAEGRRTRSADARCILNRGRLEDGRAGRVSEPASSADGVDVPVDTERGRVPRRRVNTTNRRMDLDSILSIGI